MFSDGIMYTDCKYSKQTLIELGLSFVFHC